MFLSESDLEVLARLAQARTDAPPAGVDVHRLELHIAVGTDGRRFLVQSPKPATPSLFVRPQRTVDPARWRGSLLGGALGDALGAPVENKPMDQVRALAGPHGVTDLITSADGLGRITDDTQMTLFTAEGLIRAHAQQRRRGHADVTHSLQMAYQRWLHTQGTPWPRARGPRNTQDTPDGRLIGVRGLYKRRAPGATCFLTLQHYGATGQSGSTTQPPNNSKGCGGVMRAAPAALWSDDPEAVFDIAMTAAAITHGHPSGYLPAGVLAVLVHGLIRGHDLPTALSTARTHLTRHRGHEETSAALDAAQALTGPPTPERTATLGTGAVGESALTIALYATLTTDTPDAALLASVNHDGDSDSTAAVCGNIVGALHGEAALNHTWLDRLELREVITETADDMLTEFGPTPPTTPNWTTRYPDD